MTVISLTGLFLACPSGGSGSSDSKKTPKAGDYSITGNGIQNYTGNPIRVTVTPNTGASPGDVTVKYYDNKAPTVLLDGAPSALGNYAVSFDVKAAGDWEAAEGFSAGVLSIIDPSDPSTWGTPEVADFTITPPASPITAGTWEYLNNSTPKTVTVTPKAGKSTGTITVYYTKDGTTTPSTTAPTTVTGVYTVSFNVASVTGWNARNDLSAGSLIIVAPGQTVKRPAAVDYTYKVGDKTLTAGGNVEFEYDESAKAVAITGGVSPGPIGAPKYAKAGGTPSDIAPVDAGVYTVTFNVGGKVVEDAVLGDTIWADGDLTAGTLTIKKAVPVINTGDGKWDQPTDYYFNEKLLVQPEGSGAALTGGGYAIIKPIVVSRKEKNTPAGSDIESKFSATVLPVGDNGLTGANLVVYGVVLYDGKETFPATFGQYPVTYKLKATRDGKDNFDLDTEIPLGTLDIKKYVDIAPVLTYYWVEDGILKIGSDNREVIVDQGRDLVISPQTSNGTFTGHEWFVDGVKDTAATGATYKFNRNSVGWHTVTLNVLYDGYIKTLGTDGVTEIRTPVKKYVSDTLKVSVRVPQ